MRLEWRKICFTVVMHPDGRGLMLKGVDEIQEKLEEHIVKTQQMLSSPYIAAFERHAKVAYFAFPSTVRARACVCCGWIMIMIMITNWRIVFWISFFLFCCIVCLVTFHHWSPPSRLL